MTHTFWDGDDQFVILDQFEEIQGRLTTLSSDRRYTYIELTSGTLRFDAQSDEARMCLETLEGCIGDRISILNVGNPGIRIVVQSAERPGKPKFSSDVAMG